MNSTHSSSAAEGSMSKNDPTDRVEPSKSSTAWSSLQYMVTFGGPLGGFVRGPAHFLPGDAIIVIVATRSTQEDSVIGRRTC